MTTELDCGGAIEIGDVIRDNYRSRDGVCTEVYSGFGVELMYKYIRESGGQSSSFYPETITLIKKCADITSADPSWWKLSDVCPCTGTAPDPTPDPDPIPGDDEIVIPGEEYDTCQGIVCDDVCESGDRYAGVCESGICIRGVLLESNSPTCPGFIAPEAKGRIDSMGWQACHPKAECSSTIAYWDSDVTILVGIENVGNIEGEFKIRLIDVSSGNTVSECGFASIGAGLFEAVSASFIMPHVTSLTLRVELIRNG